MKKVSSILVGVVALSSLFVLDAKSVQAQAQEGWPVYDYDGGWIQSVTEENFGGGKRLVITFVTATETKTIYLCDSNCVASVSIACQVCAACYAQCKATIEAHAASRVRERVIFITLSDPSLGSYAQGLPNGADGVNPDGSLINPRCHCFLSMLAAFGS